MAQNHSAFMRNRRKLAKSTQDFPHIDVVRGVLVGRGSSVARWARENGYKVKTVFSAAYGQRHGAISREIRRKLQREVAA